MASTAFRSSELFLYAKEDVTDSSKKFEIDVSNADVEVSGPQDYKMDFASYQFKKADDSYFSLESRFDALETDTGVSVNAAAISTLQADLAAEGVSRQAGDMSNSNTIAAEVAARVAAVAGVQSALDTQEAKQASDKTGHEAAIAQEISDRQAAVAAEAASRATDVAGLQGQITNVLGGALAENLNSLSEIIGAYQAGDTTLANQAASMLQRIADLEAVVNELTNQSL